MTRARQRDLGLWASLTSRFSPCPEAYKLPAVTPGGERRWARKQRLEREGAPMKILYFNDFRLGVLKGDNSVVDVTAVVQDIPHVGPGDLMNGLIERFSS